MPVSVAMLLEVVSLRWGSGGVIDVFHTLFTDESSPKKFAADKRKPVPSGEKALDWEMMLMEKRLGSFSLTDVCSKVWSSLIVLSVEGMIFLRFKSHHCGVGTPWIILQRLGKCKTEKKIMADEQHIESERDLSVQCSLMLRVWGKTLFLTIMGIIVKAQPQPRSPCWKRPFWDEKCWA